MSVHDQSNLSNTEKIVYLHHAIKDGSARNAIEGLSHSGDNYDEAIECLKSRFDQPHLIHHTHVQMIVDAPPLKEGTGKELKQLHDTMQQHVRALKTLGCELPGKFITSMIELKLDVDTLFEWQKHSQANMDIPHFHDLLDFIDLWAQASETSCTTQTKRVPWNDQSVRRPHGKTVTSYATSSNSTDNNCVVCKTDKHSLYVCAKFKILILKSNGLCMNCLGSGHFKQQCKSSHKCKVVNVHTIRSFTLKHRLTIPLEQMISVDFKQPFPYCQTLQWSYSPTPCSWRAEC